MKTALLLLTALIASAANNPKVTYIRSFPGSAPPYFLISVDRAGELEYKESPTDSQPLHAQMQTAEARQIFEMAEKLSFFKNPIESGLKVANTGKKTFRYQDASGAITETTFNYSLNETARHLLDRFEQIAATERAYLDLDRTARFDKLGVNDSLAEIESLWDRKQLAAPEQFVPLLTRVANHESYMHLARDRAARLKDEFKAAQNMPVADPAQK